MPKRPRKPRRPAADRQQVALRAFTDEDWDRLGWRPMTDADWEAIRLPDDALVPWEPADEETADDDGPAT